MHIRQHTSAVATVKADSNATCQDAMMLLWGLTHICWHNGCSPLLWLSLGTRPSHKAYQGIHTPGIRSTQAQQPTLNHQGPQAAQLPPKTFIALEFARHCCPVTCGNLKAMMPHSSPPSGALAQRGSGLRITSLTRMPSYSSTAAPAQPTPRAENCRNSTTTPGQTQQGSSMDICKT